MGFGAALLALSAVSAVTQVGQGYAEQAEAKANASLIEGRGQILDIQKNIDLGRQQRAKGLMMGRSTTAVAGMGLEMEGSPLAAMISAQTQMNIDQAITAFNYEQDKIYNQAEADAMKRKGKAAVTAGWTNAFSTMLQAGASYSMYSGGGGKQTAPKNKINTSGITWSDH